MRSGKKRVAMALTGLILGLSLTAGADVLHLKDGRIKKGKLQSQTDEKILFKVMMGKNYVVITYKPEEVKKIVIEADKPVRTARVKPLAEIKDKDAFLKETLRLKSDPRKKADMIRRLEHLIAASTGKELHQLSKQAEKKVYVPLDKLLARARFQIAKSQGKGRSLSVGKITDYERAALVTLLAEEQATALKTVEDTGVPEDARDKVRARREVIYAAGVTRELKRIDTQADLDQKQLYLDDLAGMRDRLKDLRGVSAKQRRRPRPKSKIANNPR